MWQPCDSKTHYRLKKSFLSQSGSCGCETHRPLTMFSKSVRIISQWNTSSVNCLFSVCQVPVTVERIISKQSLFSVCQVPVTVKQIISKQSLFWVCEDASSVNNVFSESEMILYQWNTSSNFILSQHRNLPKGDVFCVFLFILSKQVTVSSTSLTSNFILLQQRNLLKGAVTGQATHMCVERSYKTTSCLDDCTCRVFWVDGLLLYTSQRSHYDTLAKSH